MKRSITLLLALLLLTQLAGCGLPKTKAAAPTASPAGAVSASQAAPELGEVVYIVGEGTIDDGTFNQSAWEGIRQAAAEQGVECSYLVPEEFGAAAYSDAVALAVRGGAKLIVGAYRLETTFFEAQTRYRETRFLLLDGMPHSVDCSVYKAEKNTCALRFAEEQAGFLAGYAAVLDGYTHLGFLGGVECASVNAFGSGFLQGVQLGAAERGLESVRVDYSYTGSFIETPEAEETAAQWYENGTQVIFACGGDMGGSVMAAALSASGAVIGVDTDQSEASPTVVTSAIKNVKKAVYETVRTYYADEYPGGEELRLGLAEDYIGLAMENARLREFGAAEYEAVTERIRSGELKVTRNESAAALDDFAGERIELMLTEW